MAEATFAVKIKVQKRVLFNSFPYFPAYAVTIRAGRLFVIGLCIGGATLIFSRSPFGWSVRTKTYF